MLDDLLTPKQIQVLNEYRYNHNWKVMVNYGAKRSGKTFIDNFVFLYQTLYAARLAKSQGVRHPQFILGGADSGSIYSNVLSELDNMFGMQLKADKHNNLSLRWPGLPVLTIRQAYTGTIAGLKHIRGMTSFGAYVNEATMANHVVFDEIVDRCSVPGARIVCDTNPDVPTHWLKTRYIDNPSDQYISNHFTLDDNVRNLPDDYVRMKRNQHGVLYERTVLGTWTSVEGIVYDDFDKERDAINIDQYHNMTKNKLLHYFAGVDWGFEHKNSMGVFAYDDDGTIYFIDEITGRRKQNPYWLNVAKKQMAGRYGYSMPFYCDSARPDYVHAFRDAGLNAKNAYKDIIDGVGYVMSLFQNHQLKIVKDNVEDFFKEIYQYTWNEKTGKPLKKDGMDDVMDMMRYAIASHFKEQKDMAKRPSYKQQYNNLSSLGLI